MSINYIFLYISTVATGLSGSYLLYKAVGKRSRLWKSARWLYGILGVVEIYYFTIYTLVITHCIPLEIYGQYIRPIAFIMLMSPMLMAIAHRDTAAKYVNPKG
jgi:hypothetical protein